MFKNLVKLFTLVTLTVYLAACGNEKPVLKIGSKDFAESYILAEMIAILAENEGIVVERKFPFGNTAKTLEGIKQGVIDVYPEYNGTGLIFLGQAPISDGEASTQSVRNLFSKIGLEFKERFGFSNDYAIVMTKERAAELNISSIGDIATSSDGLTFAVDEDFTTRPADGLNPLLRRYGITNNSTLVLKNGTEGKAQIIDALLTGQADVGELFVTDGQIAEYDLVVLEDNLKFFPVYEPAPLVRSDALAAMPSLAGVLDKLNGVISPEEMQNMNKAVDLDAQTPATVAANFLINKGLLPEGEVAQTEKLILAAGPGVARDNETSKAISAIRSGFKGKDIQIVNFEDPLNALTEGDARIALVGSESFYSLSENGPQAKSVADAFSVVGFKTAHLISRKSGGSSSIQQMKKIVTSEKDSGSDIVLRMIVDALDLNDSVTIINSAENLQDNISSLKAGEYDGVFSMNSTGSIAMSNALKDTAIKLVGLNEWADGGYSAQFSFIRPATIAAQTYDLQFSPVSSINTQYLLASPVQAAEEIGEVGPGTAGVASATPISGDIALKINEAIGSGEVIDPAVPIHAALLPTIEIVDKSLPFSIDVSIVNILMILFVIWVIYLCFLPSPRNFTHPDSDSD